MIEAIINLFTENTYIINEGKDAFIIDPGASLDKIKSYIEKKDLNVKAVLLTHGHFDHILYINEVVEEYKCPVYLHKDERNFLFDPTLNLSSSIDKKIVFKEKELINAFETPYQIKLGNETINVLHTPGHSRGSVCYEYGTVVFTGDTLFRGSIGRSDLPTSNSNALNASLLKIIETYHDNTLIYPGHGEFSTLITEKMKNRWLKNL